MILGVGLGLGEKAAFNMPTKHLNYRYSERRGTKVQN